MRKFQKIEISCRVNLKVSKSNKLEFYVIHCHTGTRGYDNSWIRWYSIKKWADRSWLHSSIPLLIIITKTPNPFLDRNAKPFLWRTGELNTRIHSLELDRVSALKIILIARNDILISSASQFTLFYSPRFGQISTLKCHTLCNHLFSVFESKLYEKKTTRHKKIKMPFQHLFDFEQIFETQISRY